MVETSRPYLLAHVPVSRGLTKPDISGRLENVARHQHPRTDSSQAAAGMQAASVARQGEGLPRSAQQCPTARLPKLSNVQDGQDVVRMHDEIVYP